eukprot:TRINITY_DN7139_c0_g4_i1.p1 TRINITY_DN7139_c0_g4~~TRINITY_DN7139_c0_g4_i1.p1  ORF type:complete len:319 (-),score=28.16 TRINITY_DN7139_c0_g4_i1:182-1138(-)
MKYLVENKCPLGEGEISVFDQALVDKRTDLVQLLLQNGYPECPSHCNIAARNGDLTTLKLLFRKEHIQFYDSGVCEAVSKGHLACLKFLHKNGCSWNERTCQSAVKYNLLSRLLTVLAREWLPWNSKCYNTAIENNSLECLQYLVRNRCPVDKYKKKLCDVAVEHNQLDCLKYLYQYGFKWEEDTYAIASKNGNLTILKYLHKNGCAWDDGTVLSKAILDPNRKNTDCLIYVLRNGCGSDNVRAKTCNFAIQQTDLHLFKTAYKKDVQVNFLKFMLTLFGKTVDLNEYRNPQFIEQTSIIIELFKTVMRIRLNEVNAM